MKVAKVSSTTTKRRCVSSTAQCSLKVKKKGSFLHKERGSNWFGYSDLQVLNWTSETLFAKAKHSLQ